MGIAILLLAMFNANHAEFIDTASKQLNDGYSWKQIECREATPGLPAITIDAPNGKKYVCNKLIKD